MKYPPSMVTGDRGKLEDIGEIGVMDSMGVCSGLEGVLKLRSRTP